jgi:hypothetical protein
MWPSEDSGFEPSAYSPAGQLQQGSRVFDNLQDDPSGVWRAFRRSWGAKIIAGGLALIAAVAALNALLHI